MTPRIVSVHGVKTPANVPKRGPCAGAAVGFPFFPVGGVDVAATGSQGALPPSAAWPSA